MGHTVGKAVYQRLGRKIDGLTVRTPWNKELHAILKALYTTEEADLVACMPYRPSPVDRICQMTHRDVSQVQPLLESLFEKGLVMDADNVKKHIGAICSCCPCCCNILTGIVKCGYPGIPGDLQFYVTAIP